MKIPWIYKKIEESLDGKLIYDISELLPKVRKISFEITNDEVKKILGELEEFRILEQKDPRKFQVIKNSKAFASIFLIFAFSNIILASAMAHIFL